MGHTTAFNRIQQGEKIQERFDELGAGQDAIQRTVRAEASKNQAAAEERFDELGAGQDAIQRTVRAEASKNQAAAEDAIGELEAAMSEGIDAMGRKLDARSAGIEATIREASKNQAAVRAGGSLRLTLPPALTASPSPPRCG